VFENGRLDAVALPSPAEVAAGALAPLKDGDSVYVVHGKDPSSATVVVGGEVRFPGALPFVAGATAADFLEKAGGPTRDAYIGRVLLSRRLSDGDREQLRFSLESASSVQAQAQDSIKVYDVTKISLRDSVRISGAVRRPGIYARPKGLTVKDLILKAGGFRWGADWTKVRLESPVPGSEESKIDVLALDSSLAVATADRAIPPHAHVAVPFDPQMDTLQVVNVRGLVSRPGRYALERNGERLSSLWERLGGLRPDAYLAGARLIRGETGRIQIDFERALKDKGGYDDLPLRGGDSIYVPMRPATVAVLGRVNTPANVVWREGKSWKWYIEQVGGFSDSADEDKVFVRYADGSVQTREVGITSKPNPGSEVVVPFRRPPEPTTGKDVISGMNMIMATIIAGLTIFVLIKNN
jgi:protein involved in polysaccharide export with SLBB domain